MSLEELYDAYFAFRFCLCEIKQYLFSLGLFHWMSSRFLREITNSQISLFHDWIIFQPYGVSLFVCLFLNNVQELLLALHTGHIPDTTWRMIQNARSNLGQPCAKSTTPTHCTMLSHMYLPYILFQFFCVWMNKNIGCFHRSDQTETARTCIA